MLLGPSVPESPDQEGLDWNGGTLDGPPLLTYWWHEDCRHRLTWDPSGRSGIPMAGSGWVASLGNDVIALQCKCRGWPWGGASYVSTGTAGRDRKAQGWY